MMALEQDKRILKEWAKLVCGTKGVIEVEVPGFYSTTPGCR